MSTQQDKYAQLQSKLENGLEKLKKISIDDKDGMGAALIKLHGAMEDYVRLEVAQKAPHLRASVEDLKTGWKDLLEHGRTFLGFTANDCDIISEANFQRNKFAHGQDFTYTYSDLINYAQFVQKWLKRGRDPVSKDWGNKQIVESKPIPQTTYQPVSRPPVREQKHSPETHRKPWYRSTFVLLLMFFFLTPLWAILILRDRNQGFFARLFAVVMFFMSIFYGIGLLPYLATFLDTTASPPAIASPTLIESSSTVIADATSQPEPILGAGGTCNIIWVEHKEDNLAAKNRSIVWDEIVAAQVIGSGMTVREFYDSVVERNPVLVTDGYEFKKETTYLLPQCQ